MASWIQPKKKLLIATDSFLPRWDGISRFLKEVIPSLSERYEIMILAPRFTGKRPFFQDVRINFFQTMNVKFGDYTPPKPHIGNIKKAVKWADIVWSQTLGPIGALSMYYAKKRKKPVVAYIHSIEWELFSKSLKRFRRIAMFASKFSVKWLYNKCDLLMIPAESTGKILKDKGIKVKKEIVPLGVNVDVFVPPQDKKLAKETVGLSMNALVVGYFGRFGREKDLKTLYSAFQKIKGDFDFIELIFVGGDRTIVESDFKSLEKIRIIGSTDNPVPYLQAMDVYVLPSLTETTSLTTLEAMSCEVPVVCTPVGHINSYITHKENGFIFPKKNPDRLAILLKQLLKDKDLRIRVGKMGRRTVVKTYSWQKTIKKLYDVLDKVVESSE